MQSPSAPTYGSLAQNARAQELKKAKGILWFVGIITIAFNAFMLMNAENEVDREIDKEMRKAGGSLEQVRKLPDAARSEFERERTKVLGQVKLIYGGSIGLGVLFILCALAVNHKPVAATVTGLVLYLGGVAAFAALEPQTILHGIIIKILIVIGLISSVKSALALEKQQREPAQ